MMVKKSEVVKKEYHNIFTSHYFIIFATILIEYTYVYNHNKQRLIISSPIDNNFVSSNFTHDYQTIGIQET